MSGLLVNWLTIAVPEELAFRLILSGQIEKRWESRALAIAVSSVAFGVWHTPRMEGFGRYAYIVLASFCGAVYNSCYQLSGRNILAPALLHAMIDTLWIAAFRAV